MPSEPADSPQPSVRPARRRAGRPTTKVLTKERITDRALRIITNEGFASFTMTRLAAALHVTPAAMYNHAASKREILLWVQDRLMGRVDVSRFASDDWHRALVAWAVSYRDVMGKYTPLIAPIAVMPITGAPATLRMYETVASGLEAGGWPSRTIVPTIVAVESFIYGSAYDTQAPDDIFETGDDAEITPVFTAAFAAHSSAYRGNEVANVAFEIGLEALIAGMARRAGVVLPGPVEPPGSMATGQVAGVPVGSATASPGAASPGTSPPKLAPPGQIRDARGTDDDAHAGNAVAPGHDAGRPADRT